ncbi:lipid A biosynthesis lauroyl acyltransferase [Candidatus Trichorickettsia mobilis]|uniref:Lipid A biosynthesis lauroyl acyltransferase n=1 Tax=Candidatus Trichorickettsia mobilis TaxID=1346319 RepID=A0ABZ0UTY4_9RICK|nr:lipid A biosynthesis lauroyl acyltransferase [Candidatus Trichorickettsia mobilis]WPY00655.1 lipid A biosynthesis lauroyl acyltransferase [Candidatus Trichorickettsia mobilis]
MKKFLRKIKHIIEYVLFLAIINLLKLFGIDRSANLCSTLAKKIGPLLPVTHIAKKNLQAVFSDSINHQQVINELWDNFGRFIGEFPYIPDISEIEISKRVEIEGIEHIAELQRLSKPFLLFTGHFANWDFALKIINKLYYKFAIVYRKANNPYINSVINNCRASNNIALIAKGPQGAKDLIRAMKSGHSIAMLVDQKMNDGIKVPFFGKPAMTAHAIAKFALQFKYPIIPCQIIRTTGSYFKIIIHSPLQYEQTNDLNIDCYNIMLKINQILEEWIKQRPGQWFWFHNRW